MLSAPFIEVFPRARKIPAPRYCEQDICPGKKATCHEQFWARGGGGGLILVKRE
jgi:hypothetical protein